MGCSASSPALEQNSVEVYKAVVEHDTFTESTILIDDLVSGKRNITKWIPNNTETIKGVVFISHGLHEHSLRYYGLAHALTSKGYEVYGIDHVGHGLSNGKRALINDYNALVSDFAYFVNHIYDSRTKGTSGVELPAFIVSHSMGTLVALLAMKKLSTIIKGVVYSGCPIHAGPAASSPFGFTTLYPLSQTSAAVYLTYAMSSMAPEGPAAPLFLDALCTDSEALQLTLRDDRRYDGDIKNKTAYEIIKMINVVKKEVASVNYPIFVMCGSDDTIALPDGSKFIYDNSVTVKEEKSIKMYMKSKHELFNDKPVGEECITDVVEYFESIVVNRIAI